MAGLFDTHTHLLDPRFDEDREALLQELPGRGIELMLNVACSAGDIEPLAECAERHDYVYVTAGIHPHEAAQAKAGDLEKVRAALHRDKFVAVGEIGLDYYYDLSPRDVQKEYFMAQLELAKELQKPAIIHIRDAFGDAMALLRTFYRQGTGVLHCFSGSYEVAKECVNMGMYISFAGPLTFDNAVKLREVAAKLPKDRVLIETDCPYLAPVPMRGKRNDPGFVLYTAKKLAEIWNMELKEVIDITNRNGRELFSI